MKKGLILLFCLSIILVNSFSADAIDEKGKWSLGLNFGYYFPELSGEYNYNDIILQNIEGYMETSDDLIWGINFNYRLTDSTFFQVMWEHYKGDLDFSFSAIDGDNDVRVNFDSDESSEITIMPFSLDFGCSFLKAENYDVYALLGSTYYYSTNHIYRPSEYGNYSIDYPEDNDSTIGFNIGGGADYFFTKRFAANIDLRYYWGEADFNTENDYNLGGFRGSCGLKIILGTIEE